MKLDSCSAVLTIFLFDDLHFSVILLKNSGVARSLLLGGGGQSASVAIKVGGLGDCPRENFGGQALQTLEKRGKHPF